MYLHRLHSATFGNYQIWNHDFHRACVSLSPHMAVIQLLQFSNTAVNCLEFVACIFKINDSHHRILLRSAAFIHMHITLVKVCYLFLAGYFSYIRFVPRAINCCSVCRNIYRYSNLPFDSIVLPPVQSDNLIHQITTSHFTHSSIVCLSHAGNGWNQQVPSFFMPRLLADE